MGNDLIISTHKINKRLKGVEKRPQNLIGWGNGHDFPSNDNQYPAKSLGKHTSWKKFYHLDRKINYFYDIDYEGWLSEQSFESFGKQIDNFDYIQVIEDYHVVITRILIGLKSFDTIIKENTIKNLSIRYTSNGSEGSLLSVNSKELKKRTDSFYTYTHHGYFPFADGFELFLVSNEFILSNFYINFSISYRLIG